MFVVSSLTWYFLLNSARGQSLRHLHSQLRQRDVTGALDNRASAYATAVHLPSTLREQEIATGPLDKIFTAKWLSESELILGSKCNKASSHEREESFIV
jgi:hypothetical protein